MPDPSALSRQINHLNPGHQITTRGAATIALERLIDAGYPEDELETLQSGSGAWQVRWRSSATGTTQLWLRMPERG